MTWLFINSTDQSTITISQEIFTQNASLNYTDATTALQSNVVADVQPISGDLAQSESGGDFRATHLMLSQRYANVLTNFNDGDGHLIVTLDSTIYEVHQVKDFTTHLEYLLEQRM